MKSLASNSTRLLKLSAISLILGLTVMTSACSNDTPKDDQASSESATDKKDKSKQDKDEKQPVPVEVVEVEKGDIRQTYSTITTLEAENDADIVARSTGLLREIYVEEGDKVKKGQLLAQLDIEQLQLEVSQMRATLNKLEKELQRQQTLFSRKLGSSDSLDRAKFEFQSQQAQFKLSQLKLQYASIKAPIDGVITQRHVKTGNLIRENDLLFKIVDLSTLQAVLHLPERELTNIKKDQEILLQVDALKGKIIRGKVARIRPSIDSDTGTFRVVATLINESQELRAGMFGKVEVVFDTHQDTLVLQQQALITQDNRSHVFVVRDNKAIQTPVEVGFSHKGLVEITSGLALSDKVITTGQQILKHETLVEIVTDEIAEEVEKKANSNIANVVTNQ
ncbi:efflux RND transporter periplasmic adaptor subunit [Aliikangiella sp. IMCC44632]